MYRLLGKIFASFVEFRQVAKEELQITAEKCDDADNDTDDPG